MGISQPPDVRDESGASRLPLIAGVNQRPRLRMLISSAGRRVGLLRAFRSSADAAGVDLEVFACDVEPEWSSACLASDYAFAVPPATSDGFIDAVLDLCARHAIALVVPTIDTELMAFAKARARFAAIGTLVAVGEPDVIATARDKLATAHFLATAGIASPKTVDLADFPVSGLCWTWPLIAKPRHGSSSRGIHIVHNLSELESLALDEPYIVQEMLCGREYTVNLFFDESGKLQCAIPHQRLKVRGGEVEKGVTSREPGLCEIADDLACALGSRPFGAMCFQAIIDGDGRAAVFEINARFGGGYPLAHRAGATFARWLIEQRLDLPRTMGDDWEDNVVMLRFDDAVFV
jgi:carbamoyl-phosphate synthase large subunit